MTRLPIPCPDGDGELTTAEARPDEVAGILTKIMDGFRLTDFERELVLQKLNEQNQTISTPRAGKTLNAVVTFLKQEKTKGAPFTLDEVRAVLLRNGVQATPKEIYNSLGYLTRKRYVENVGYGQYEILGEQVTRQNENAVRDQS